MTTGSIWRKWDLHTHTKNTNKNDQFASSSLDDFFFLFFKKAFDNNVEGIGITDYFSIDNYLKAVEYVNEIDQKLTEQGDKLFSDEEIVFINNIFLFPNVELRMLPCTGVEKLINIHCLFNPEYVHDLTNDFFNTLENQDNFKMNRQGMIAYGKSLKPQLTNDDAAFKEGVNNFAIDIKTIKSILDKNQKFRDNTIIAVSNSNRDGNSGLQKHYKLFGGDESSLDGVRKTIYKISNVVFSANPKDIKYFLGERLDSIADVTKEQKLEERKTVLFERGSYKPCIVGSDAHKEDELFSKNTWIKSDKTFEGLKQIIFEPKHRVFIGADAPINPFVRIDKVKFDFPTDASFENEVFCLAGKREINFSPNFTCLIGGRGTGKSTILNLIHEKLKPGENKFFQSKKIKDQSSKFISIKSSVKIDDDLDEKYVEFLSQNEVEEFAQDYQKLTSAVYSRILKRDENGLINTAEIQLKEKLVELRAHILLKRKQKQLQKELEQKIKEQETNKKLVDSFSSSDYKVINDDIKTITTKLTSIVSAIEQHNDLIQELKDIIEKNQQTIISNQYSIEIERINKEIAKIIENNKSIDFKQTIEEKESLRNQLTAKKAELKKYLSDKGLTEESQQDISNANIIISQLETEIEKKKTEISETQKKIESFKMEDSTIASSNYKLEIEKQIKSISSILEKLENASVKPISLKFEFDKETAIEEIFTDFKLIFESQLNKSNHKGDNILREILFTVQPDRLSTKANLITSIQRHSSNSSAKQFLIELLSNESNFESYKLLSEMKFLNYSEFKKVKVLYDGRPIENSSFGQRCTAVLVILLLLGNNPIIIDEPEAHLDSLLISNYLVDVIKDRKISRQIIFATHNANFVINGDSELIHILNIDESTLRTKIVSTTIENESSRETLISLEGGKEAFIKRENKYQFYKS